MNKRHRSVIFFAGIAALLQSTLPAVAGCREICLSSQRWEYIQRTTHVGIPYWYATVILRGGPQNGPIPLSLPTAPGSPCDGYCLNTQHFHTQCAKVCGPDGSEACYAPDGIRVPL